MRNATRNKAFRWASSLLVVIAICSAWRLTIIDNAYPEIAGLYSMNRVIFNLVVTGIGGLSLYLLLGKGALRTRLFEALTVTVATLLTVFAIELPVLVAGFDYRPLLGGSSGDTTLQLSRGINREDPVLMSLHWPNSSFTGSVEGNLVSMGILNSQRYMVDVHYDRIGFRNDQEYHQADIAVIGDSFVEAAIVPRDKSLVGLLQEQLKLPVVNLGQINYGFRQELEVLQRFALPLNPKLIVWVLFGGNDLRDVKHYEEYLRRNQDSYKSSPVARKLFTTNAVVVVSSLIERPIRNYLETPRKKAIEQSGLFTSADGTAERVYFGQTADPWTQHEWNVAVDTLSEARQLSVENGAKFVVAYVPRKFRIYQKHLALDPSSAIAHWTVSDLPGALGRWARDNDMKFIDLSPYLEQLVAKGENPYFVDDVHWNELGHATAARVIIDYLTEHRLFPFSLSSGGSVEQVR